MDDKKPVIIVAGKEIIKRLDLPTPGAYVLLLTNPKASVFEKQIEEEGSISIKQIIAYLIREWNFADEQGNILEITKENADLALSILDTHAINKFIGLDQIMSTQKKTN